MRIVIEARYESAEGSSLRIPLSTVEHAGTTKDRIGLSLAEGRALIAKSIANRPTRQP